MTSGLQDYWENPDDPAPRHNVRMSPCPFCGGSATLLRERNVDKLVIAHTSDCAIKNVSGEIWHWGSNIPDEPFASWNKRSTSLEDEVERLGRERTDIIAQCMTVCRERDHLQECVNALSLDADLVRAERDAALANHRRSMRAAIQQREGLKDVVARVERLEALLRKSLTIIDELEGHLPMDCPAQEELYRESVAFGEEICQSLAIKAVS